uniref:Uncharacterized protein n=1 Tax=Trichuris muris TaxID=70415 RepID=A0A5S6Q7E3_TRIMR
MYACRVQKVQEKHGRRKRSDTLSTRQRRVFEDAGGDATIAFAGSSEVYLAVRGSKGTRWTSALQLSSCTHEATDTQPSAFVTTSSA